MPDRPSLEEIFTAPVATTAPVERPSLAEIFAADDKPPDSPKAEAAPSTWDTIKQGAKLAVQNPAMFANAMTEGVAKPAVAGTVQAVRPAAEMGGMVAGGILGTPAGPAGNVGGAALGYGIAKGGLDAAERWSKNQPQPGLGQSAVNAANDLATGATYEMGGQVAGKAIGSGLEALSSLRANSTSKALAESYAKAGIESATPANLTNSKTLSLLESYLNYSPGSADAMAKRAAGRIEELTAARTKLINAGAPQEQVEIVGNRIKDEARKILSRNANFPQEKIDSAIDVFAGKAGLGETPYTAGEKVKGVVGEAFTKRKGDVSGLYQEAEDAGGIALNKKFETPQAMNVAKQLMKEEMAKPPASRDKGLLAQLRDFLPQEAKKEQSSIILTDAPPSPPKMENPKYTWEGLKKTKTDFNTESARVKAGNATKGTSDTRALDMLSEAIDKDMYDYSQRVGGDFGAKYDAARAAARKLHQEDFPNELMRTVSKNPEDVVNAVLKKGEVTLIKQVKNAGGEQAIQPVREEFNRRAIESSIDKNGKFDPAKMVKYIKDNLGPDGMRALYNRAHLESFDNLARDAASINAQFAGKQNREIVQFLKTMASSSPDKVVDFVFKPENVKNIRYIKRLLPKEMVADVETAAVAKVLKTAPNLSVGDSGLSLGEKYLPRTSTNQFKRYESVLKELLPPERMADMSRLVELGEHMGNVEKLMTNASQTAQTQNVMNLIRAGLKTTGIVPTVNWLAAKMYLSPAARSFLIGAYHFPPNSQQAISLFTRGLEVIAQDQRKGQ